MYTVPRVAKCLTTNAYSLCRLVIRAGDCSGLFHQIVLKHFSVSKYNTQTV